MEQKTKNIIMITGAVAIMGTAIFIVINGPKKKKLAQKINDILDAKIVDPNKPAGQAIISSADMAKLPVGNFPLKVGDANQKVYALQQALNRNYGTSLDLDGKFGQGLYKVLCDKYFNYGCTVLGKAIYDRKIESSDMDAINNHKN